jgi:ribonuclease P protein component
MSDQRFRAYEHLRRPADFQRVYDRRRSVSDEQLIVYARDNDLPYNRLGLSVSRKFGGAVQRNRLRRLFREVFRLTKQNLPTGLDLVLIPRTREELSLAALMEAMPKLITQVAKKLAKDQQKEKP